LKVEAAAENSLLKFVSETDAIIKREKVLTAYFFNKRVSIYVLGKVMTQFYIIQNFICVSYFLISY